MLYPDLPALAIADELNALLRSHNAVVVTAAPGAGKSTLLPLTILDGLGAEGRILMLEPRRIATRQIAERMAFLRGEAVGQTVGYRMRFETKVSKATRIEVQTEGVLTRRLIDDPTLEGVDVVIFDEFHERSLITDEALALVRETQALLREDLKIVIMSATIDADSICKALGAPLLECEGRMFPVDVRYAAPKTDDPVRSCAEDVAHQIRIAHRECEGDILAFLPGEADIRRAAELLGEALSPTEVYPLYGQLPADQQKAAIAPSAPGRRKVVLATNVAETSLTIEGVRCVVDCGFHRKMVYDPQSTLSHLETVRVSMDMARQRAGRAGRTAPGVCYRLWSPAVERTLPDCRKPEIEEAELSSLLLDIACWGATPSELPWLTPPPAQRVREGQQLLGLLGAVDGEGRVTAHGRRLASIPTHPRIAQMLCTAASQEEKGLACDVAALIEEGDSQKWNRISRNAEQLRRIAGVGGSPRRPELIEAGHLIAAAFPERVGKASDEAGKYLLASGETLVLDHADPMTAYQWLAIVSRHLCAPLMKEDALKMATEYDNVGWNSREGALVARREWRIGRLVVESKPLSVVSQDQAEKIICEAVAKDGLSMLDFNEDVGRLQRRVGAVAGWHPELELPDLSTEAVLKTAPQWLPLWIGKARSTSELKKIDLCQALWGILSFDQQQTVERLAPSTVVVPTGSHIRLDYRQGVDAPVLRVRLQECFGLLDTPRVDDGRLPVLMELLSPGFKPVQLTSDLRSFWSGTYFEVRKELRRRYPKHSWPDNPLDAIAVRGTKRS